LAGLIRHLIRLTGLVALLLLILLILVCHFKLLLVSIRFIVRVQQC
jgi:hypothetical protein